jgi:hypothetical protein
MSAGSPHTVPEGDMHESLIADLACEGGFRDGTCLDEFNATTNTAAPDLLLFHFYIAGKGIRPLLERFTVGCKVDPTYPSSKAGASSHAASLEAASESHALRLMPPLLMNEAGMPWRPPGGVGGGSGS